MADSKSKKTAKTSQAKPKKIADVTGPGAPSKSSRQIIVNNRQVMRDPMVSAGNEAGDPVLEPSTETKVEVKRLSKKASPEDSAAPSDKPAATANATEGLRTIQPLTPDFSETDDKTRDDDSEPKEKLLNLDEKPATKGAPDLSESEDTDVAATADKPVNQTAKDDSSQATDSEAAEDSTEQPETEESADEAKTPESSADNDKPAPADPADTQPDKSPTDEPAKQDAETDSEDTDKAEVKPPKGRQLTAEQAKAIESGKYFLPIQTADNRRARRDAIIFVILGIVLILIWLDVLLDADLISLGGAQPLTNFL